MTKRDPLLGQQLRTFPARLELRETAAGAGKSVIRLAGYASVTEAPYEMWDWAGKYFEVISQGAFARTLGNSADVALLLNHGGMTLARTKSGTLRLSEDDTGLAVEADLEPRMSAVNDMRLAMERGDLDEMSFAFMVERQAWSPDYSELRIDEVNINKGDVSVVNYGANPATSVGLRARDLLSAIHPRRAAAISAALRSGRVLAPGDATLMAQVLGIAVASTVDGEGDPVEAEVRAGLAADPVPVAPVNFVAPTTTTTNLARDSVTLTIPAAPVPQDTPAPAPEPAAEQPDPAALGREARTAALLAGAY